MDYRHQESYLSEPLKNEKYFNRPTKARKGNCSPNHRCRGRRGCMLTSRNDEMFSRLRHHTRNMAGCNMIRGWNDGLGSDGDSLKSLTEVFILCSAGAEESFRVCEKEND